MNELKTEAIGLGIEFKGNISRQDLSQLIEDHYENQAADDLVQEAEDVPDEEPEDIVEVVVKSSNSNRKSKEEILRTAVVEARKQAFKKHKVRITSNDKRDNEYVTTAYLGFENQYFSLDRIVPLDVPVELEECLINIAKTAPLTLHKDEIVNGKRTGNKIPVQTRKYNVGYED